jgi:hypothetical protein
MEIMDERAESLKKEGNDFYAAKFFEAAIQKYSEVNIPLNIYQVFVYVPLI